MAATGRDLIISRDYLLTQKNKVVTTDRPSDLLSDKKGMYAFNLMAMLLGVDGSTWLEDKAAFPQESVNQTDLYRPTVDFTPKFGFMNDPNGLIWDGSVYHLYFQHETEKVVAGSPRWGHATSNDLLHWVQGPTAIDISPDGEGNAFSGSCVYDRNNTSGLWSAGEPGGLVAIYTRAFGANQSQWVASSHDGGKTFVDYPLNPVIDIGSDQFRDPDVKWHAETKRWIMSVAKSREHKIAFYSSPDLLHWQHESDFGPSGTVGIDYECPDIFYVDGKWVLLVSVNPGAPQGGSATQYFVGDFNGTVFTPTTTVTNWLDFAKDNYAGKLWTDMPGGEAVYITWLGNWQYCQKTPTAQEGWRSAMSLPRTLRLEPDQFGNLKLYQQPRGIEALRRNSTSMAPSANSSQYYSLPADGNAVEVVLTANMSSPEGNGYFEMRIENQGGEFVSIGYDVSSTSLWIDRGHLSGFSNPFFTDKFSTALGETTILDLRVVFDRSTLEVYAMNGLHTATLAVFPRDPLTHISVSGEGIANNATGMLYTLQKCIG